MGLLQSLATALFVSGAILFSLVPTLRVSGQLKLGDELMFPLLVLGGFPLATASCFRGVCPPVQQRVLYELGANVLLLSALVFQLRANSKKADSGPTHPKNEPYDELGSQDYLWDEDEN